MGYGISAVFETQKSATAVSISSAVTWTAIGTQFTNPVRLLFVQNHTDAELQFSFDGTNAHLNLLALTDVVLDLSSDGVLNNGLWFAKGSKVYVRRIGTPTAGGFVYVSGIYGKGD